ncbi:unnamed protein product [Rotaria sp. Silwood2]|nr:unnamed protein product [Rotaria sp. Silwood2]CAF2952630.1 unnamed protein product [Rotaria sp. Silwood2]CAF3321178.1 unnamed protein product [Rotaria sp. Silwood2]CAF4124372.1 unnamed protein product [Rotaria sp. Silwood2]CAF4158002.1 unnamed protein product [Rotaria sp. Silwood2]
MEHPIVQLIDLSDELLLMIFKNMKKALALYSLIGINKRFENILLDPIFMSHLNLMTCASNGLIYPMRKKTIDRFCSHILPKGHHKVEWLNLEVSSMERLLLTTDYPNLHGLGLFNIQQELDEYLFNDKSSFAHIFKNQILALVIKFDKNKGKSLMENIAINTFKNILTIFTNLRYLSFDAPLNRKSTPILLDWQHPQTFSSTSLKERHIN